MDKSYSHSCSLSVKILPGLYFVLSFTYTFKIIRRHFIEETAHENGIQFCIAVLRLYMQL